MFSLKLAYNLIAASIASDSPHECDASRAQGNRRNCLVGSFTARNDQEFLSHNCLPYRGKFTPTHNIIGVCASDYDDVPCGCLCHMLYLINLSMFKRQLSPIHFLRKRLDRILP